MRTVIRLFDALVRRWIGVFEFSSGEDSLLRLQVGKLSRRLELPGLCLEKDEPVLLLHLWNERVSPLPLEGADLLWATKFARKMVHSMQTIANIMGSDPRFAGVRAVGGVTVLLSFYDDHLVERLGFTVRPYINPLGRFGEFWENLYTWLLMWTYNPVSLEQRRLLNLRRFEFWISAEEFLQRYNLN